MVNSGKLTYSFSVSEEINRFFTDVPFEIEYPENISNVPKSILAIPFVCNVLPIIWLTDSTLFLEEIDKAFYESIPEFKSGYVKMYPNAEFKGEIKVERIVENSFTNEGKAAMFYSGGLDSASTLITHLEEKPILLSIWGSDIRYDNKEGWDVVHSAIAEASEKYGLEEYVFKSTFREFDNESALGNRFSRVLGDGWWHGIKHSLGLLGHIAPFVFKHKISIMYIAASNCDKYPPEPCASNPDVDNHVRFCSCNIIHDGYNFSRQDKIHNVVQFCKKNEDSFNLHVCWVIQNGMNCCRCEKCYRTMIGIWAEGVDPCDFGFEEFNKTYTDFMYCFQREVIGNYSHIRFFPEIQETAFANIRILKESKYYAGLKWYLKIDFSNLENVKMPLSYRMRNRLSHMSFYKKLHVVKERIKGKK